MSPGRPVLDLLDRYQPRDDAEAADAQRIRELVAAVPDPWLRSNPLHVTASAVIVHPDSGRVLLRWHERQQAWLQVGGHGDPGESDPLAIAMREATEETGLTDLRPWPDAELWQVTIVPVPASGSEPAHAHADVRFTFATGHPEAARAESPGAPLRWLPAGEAAAATTEANLRVMLSRIHDRLARSRA